MDDMTERERWAEVEARQFEKNADSLMGCLDGWLKHDPNPDSYRQCADIVVKAQCWRDAARSLRQPYYMRLEREAMEPRP